MIRRATLTASSLCRRPVARFARDEDGSLMLFGMCLFMLMLMLGGLAVDLMRYEQRRTALQQTIDRSVLAAASLTQDLDPEDVVNDYFEKAGLQQYLRNVTVTEGLNFRNVSATADAELDPFFTPMVGIDEFLVPAASQAEQRITNVEISMVLDVSGSMAGTKLTNLKTAARNFVTTVLGGDGDDRISINIVPYNGQVNLGPTLRSKFNATANPGVPNVNCIDLPSSVYGSMTMSRTLTMPMTAHADTYSSTTRGTSYLAIQGHTLDASNRPSNNWCPPSTGNVVSVMGTDIETLKTKIDAFEAIGATSINAGLRWGLTLLDPGQRPLIEELVGAGEVPADFSGRPYDWDDDEAMKVIVLMTDGSHFAEDRLNTTYKSGTAPIWYNASTNTFLIRHTSGRPTAAGTREYFIPSSCTSSNCTGGSNTGEAWFASVPAGYTQQTWPQVWARARVQWVAWQLYARALGTSSTTRNNTYNTWMSNFRTQTAIPDMDAQLKSMCDLAKAQNVVVYGIAFEAPAAGQTVIADCATRAPGKPPEESGYYFNATDSAKLTSAFSAIASNISQLRLTQ